MIATGPTRSPVLHLSAEGPLLALGSTRRKYSGFPFEGSLVTGEHAIWQSWFVWFGLALMESGYGAQAGLQAIISLHQPLKSLRHFLKIRCPVAQTVLESTV